MICNNSLFIKTIILVKVEVYRFSFCFSPHTRSLGFGGNKNLIIIEFNLLTKMHIFKIQVISILSKIVNSLAIHCQVVIQSTKHQLLIYLHMFFNKSNYFVHGFSGLWKHRSH